MLSPTSLYVTVCGDILSGQTKQLLSESVAEWLAVDCDTCLGAGYENNQACTIFNITIINITKAVITICIRSILETLIFLTFVNLEPLAGE